jgi:hypothetical protein
MTTTRTITLGGLTIDVRHVPYVGWIAAFTRSRSERQLHALGASTLEEATKEALDLATDFGRKLVHNPYGMTIYVQRSLGVVHKPSQYIPGWGVTIEQNGRLLLRRGLSATTLDEAISEAQGLAGGLA